MERFQTEGLSYVLWSKIGVLPIHMAISYSQIYIVGQNFKVFQMTSKSTYIWSIELKDLWYKKTSTGTTVQSKQLYSGSFFQELPL